MTCIQAFTSFQTRDGYIDVLDDFVTMGLKGEALVEDGVEVEKLGDFDDGEGR